MAAMKITFYVLFAVIAGLAGYLCWQNRASEKVVVTFWSTLTLGAMATFVSLLFSLRSETKEAEFLSIYTIERKTKLPLVPHDQMWVRGYTDRQTHLPIGVMIEELRATKPEIFKNEEDFGTDIYKGFALRNVFDALAFAYRRGWSSKVRRFQIPHHASLNYSGFAEEANPSDYVELARFQELFPKRYLGKPEPAGPFTRFGVPQGTVVSAKDDDFSQELVLENRFSTVRISLSFTFGSRGSGILQELLPLNDKEDDRFAMLGFVVKIHAKFNPLRIGHPDMERHKRWVDGLIAELRETMESERHWKTVSEEFVLRKRIPAPAK